MSLTKQQKQLKKRYSQELNAIDRIDQDMICESIKNYIVDEISYQDQVCLDLGANLGAFSKIALDGGAKRVWSVECDLRNYQIAAANFSSDLRVNVVHAAVSGSNQKTLQIYKSTAKSNHSSTSIIKRRGKFTEYDEVKNYHIDHLLEEIAPDIIKIDIEGAEYHIIESIMEYKPKVLFIELHGNNEQSTSVKNRLIELYQHNRIEAIEIFKRVGGWDCLFYD
jgi:FkbM family methyltransferase